MLTRRCVACGHEVVPIDVLNGCCPDCGCRFEDRSPRTYAEMEGFEAVAEWVPMPFPSVADAAPAADDGRLRRRWMIFVAGVLGGLVAIVWILGAVTP